MTSNTELVITSEARRHIQAIFQYTLEVWGFEQAEAYETILHNAFSLLRRYPEMGHEIRDAPGWREHHLRHHTIVYRYDHDAARVTILRVVSHRRGRRR
jgi:plasmid stabilization system protein ParE